MAINADQRLAAALSRLDSATAHLEAPFAIVDLAAFHANAATMVSRAAGKPIRLATKSVRCRHLIEQVLALEGFRGRGGGGWVGGGRNRGSRAPATPRRDARCMPGPSGS